ncbi:ThiF family adenylyltransferase [Bacteroidota bacterium]
MNKDLYNELFIRNKGILLEKEQNILKNSMIAVFGLGGLGGVICEILVRTGIEKLIIIDKDVYDSSNSNRQIYANTTSVGKLKTDETEKRLKEINPNLQIEKYIIVDEDNISQIMKNVNLAILALDETLACINISRECKKKKIPLIEGWALPYGNVRVFSEDTPTLEEVYNLPTINKHLNSISEDEKKELNLHMLLELRIIDGIEQYYTGEAMERIKQKLIPSFAPMVWLTACIMSFEVIKILLNKPRISYSPKLNLFDPYYFKCN